MNKKVLAIYYSQTGQLRHIIDSFTAPLIAAGNNVEKVQVKLVNDYPFPWTGRNFTGSCPIVCLKYQPNLNHWICSSSNTTW